MKIKLHRLIKDLDSATYHAVKGTYSSSQFKDLLDDPEILYRKHVAKTEAREEVPAFAVGTYFHTAVLEPEKLEAECAVFDGVVRRGREWDQFVTDHPGKALLTKPMAEQARDLVATVLGSPVAMAFLERGEPEVSLFTKLWIHSSNLIVSPKHGKWLCPLKGEWVSFDPSKSAELGQDSIELIIKVRADMLGDKFILDLKSTTGNAKSEHSMRSKISAYQYDLSAALYADMFKLNDQKRRDFIWTFASKDFRNTKTYLASETNIQVGRAKWVKAILSLADCIRKNWKMEDTLGVLAPMHFELEHLKN